MNDDRGQILILTAIAMVVLLATAALALDAAYMYDVRNHLFSAADAAAKGGAVEKHRNKLLTEANVTTFAKREIVLHGIDPDAADITLHVYNPPVTGHWIGNDNYVEVTLAQERATFFARLIGILHLFPGARAVAGTSSSLNCLITCPNGNCGGGTGIQVGNMGGGMTSINAGCGVQSGGNLFVGTTSSLIADPINIAGTCTGPTCPAGTTQNSDTPGDPLSNLPTLTAPSPCTATINTMGGTTSASAGCYASITINNNDQLNLGPGTYIVTGLFQAKNNTRLCLNAGCTFDFGNGVLIYLTGMGQIDFANSSTVMLNAQTSGDYNGILFFQDPSDTHAATFNNGSGSYTMSGALYFPNADVQFGNTGTVTNDCSMIVAKSLTIMNGHASFTNGCSKYGGSPILTVSLAE